MKSLFRIFCFTATILTLFSCNVKSKGTLPNVSGKAGEVIVVMNKGDWENALGNDVRTTLGADFPFLPQREPLYSIVNISTNIFSDMFKIHRNIIIFNIKADVTANKVIFKYNVWARPQCVIQLNAQNSDEALTLFDKNKEKILATIEQAERDRIIANCKQYEESNLSSYVDKIVGGSPHFPVGYRLMKKSEDFIWIQDERQYSIQGIFVYKYPTPEKDPFSEESILSHRNEIMKNNVPGMRDNSWMTTSYYKTPSVKFIKYKNMKFAETRGLWEVHNDYMGGPFVSHSFYSKDGKDIITVEGFVYAPKYDKRQYLRQVEAIVYSFEWASEQENEKNIEK